MSESELQEIRKMVNIQERDLSEIKVKQARSEVLVERTLEMFESFQGTINQFSTTMNEVQTTMVRISMNLENNSDATNKLSTKVDGLSKKVDAIEDKDKFDIMVWINKNFVPLLLAIGGAIYVYATYIKK